MKLWPFAFAAVAIIAAVFTGYYFLGSHHGFERSDVFSKTAWQRMALPGQLSSKHAFLEHNCDACHTAVKGVEAGNCIACHANNESVLQRQPSGFHANVSSCQECHREHQGSDHRPTEMDHVALASIGLRRPASNLRSDSDSELARKGVLDWIGQHQPEGLATAGKSNLTPEEAILNCAFCHSKKDRHVKLFGQDCGQCHATAKWTIPEFRHPPPSSTDCAQCHQAPPSHYMMHFKMISMKIAGKPNAQVNQCFQCHQTTAWNDIVGVGYYKHH